MKKTLTCSATGCLSSSRQEGTKFFNFPRNPARALVWAGKVGISCTIDSAGKLHNKFLCSRHFSESDFTTAERVHLNRVVVPFGSDFASQSCPQPPVPLLPSPCLDPLSSVLTPKSAIHDVTPTTNIERLAPTPVTSTLIHADVPSTSFQVPAVQPSPTSTNTFAVKETSFPLSPVNVNASDGELGHISRQSSSSKPRSRRSILRDLNLASISEMTPRKRKLYKHIRRKESSFCKLKKKYKAKNMEQLCDVNSDPLMQTLSSSFSLEAVRLLAGIFRNRRQKPKGRRWNLDDKLLALSLLKRSPKSYVLLRKMLPLPSVQSLQSVLNAVPFRTGINARVFHALELSLQRMSDRDHYCCLMFDEMSIRENLLFNQKFDCIEGFEDCGSLGRTRNIANHALVFMIHGLHRKWKQPVAYYFTRGNTKAVVTVQYLKEVLDACQNAGLTVAATVCDMGANNVKALKLLGATFSKPYFRFHNQEIATVYDPPHLLKCTRNLFLKHDVQFKSERVGNQLPVIAKWEHLLKLYELDKCRLIRQMTRVTDTHLNPTAQSSMKVKLAAQIMSHTVAAGLCTLVSLA